MPNEHDMWIEEMIADAATEPALPRGLRDHIVHRAQRERSSTNRCRILSCVFCVLLGVTVLAWSQLPDRDRRTAQRRGGSQHTHRARTSQIGLVEQPDWDLVEHKQRQKRHSLRKILNAF